jgi:hypothetical protein
MFAQLAHSKLMFAFFTYRAMVMLSSVELTLPQSRHTQAVKFGWCVASVLANYEQCSKPVLSSLLACWLRTDFLAHGLWEYISGIIIHRKRLSSLNLGHIEKSKAKPWRSVLDQSTDSDEDLKDTEGGVCIFRGYVFAIYIWYSLNTNQISGFDSSKKLGWWSIICHI